MSSSSTSVIQPTGLVHGHSECRYLDETIPVLSHILALELVDRRDGEATMKHPNTGWKLILHEGGADVKDKPERNHYGVRVSNNQEIESYENRHKAGLPERIAYPWKTRLTEKEFPGRGYVPQAMTHGTIECVNLDKSVKFYREALGLDVITHVPTVRPHDIKHPSNPWYVVSLEIPGKNRKYLTALQRHTVTVESPSALADAHKELQTRCDEFGITAIEAIQDTADGQSFLLSDLDHNWWEIAYQRN
jgi:catechol 2,3-dioxygenase-like lactoylglutathione lyase family enzyme